MRLNSRSSIRAAALVVPAAAALILLNPGGNATARSPHEAVTFARDVAPIMQRKCQACHQPGSIAPMSLLTYEDAKRIRAARSRSASTAREMPPWHIDKTVGIQDFKNDGGLSDAEITTICDWVDAGAPQGDKKDMPPPVKFADPNEWQLAEKLGQARSHRSHRRRTRSRRRRRTSGIARRSRPDSPSRAGCARSK